MSSTIERLRTERLQGYWRYEVALYRGDDLVDQGTIKEVAERQGILKQSIYYYLQPVAHRRADKGTAKLRAIRTDI